MNTDTIDALKSGDFNDKQAVALAKAITVATDDFTRKHDLAVLKAELETAMLKYQFATVVLLGGLIAALKLFA